MSHVSFSIYLCRAGACKPIKSSVNIKWNILADSIIFNKAFHAQMMSTLIYRQIRNEDNENRQSNKFPESLSKLSISILNRFEYDFQMHWSPCFVICWRNIEQEDKYAGEL